MPDNETGSADLAFLSEVVGFAKGLYARRARRHPFGAYRTADGTGTMVAPQSAVEGDEDVMDALRLACMRAGAIRTAVAYERIEFDVTNDEEAEHVQRWRESGKNPLNHPRARMTLIVAVESEDGQSVQTCHVGRNGTGLDPRDAVFEPWGSEQIYDPLMSGHYLKSADRIKPEMRAWSRIAAGDLAFNTAPEIPDTRH